MLWMNIYHRSSQRTTSLAVCSDIASMGCSHPNYRIPPNLIQARVWKIAACTGIENYVHIQSRITNTSPTERVLFRLKFSTHGRIDNGVLLTFLQNNDRRFLYRFNDGYLFVLCFSLQSWFEYFLSSEATSRLEAGLGFLRQNSLGGATMIYFCDSTASNWAGTGFLRGLATLQRATLGRCVVMMVDLYRSHVIFRIELVNRNTSFFSP